VHLKYINASSISYQAVSISPCLINQTKGGGGSVHTDIVPMKVSADFSGLRDVDRELVKK
jgi:hypothetical protein